MGHSILVYDDRRVRLHDVDLIVAVLLLVTTRRRSLEARDAPPEQSQDVHRALDALERSVMTWAVGFVDVDLEQIVTSDEVRRDLVRSLTAAQAALEHVDHFDGTELLRDAFGADAWGPGGLTVHTTRAATAGALGAIRGMLSQVETQRGRCQL